MPTAFEAQLYFHVVQLMNRKVETKKENSFRKAVISTVAGIKVRLLKNVQSALIK